MSNTVVVPKTLPLWQHMSFVLNKLLDTEQSESIKFILRGDDVGYSVLRDENGDYRYLFKYKGSPLETCLEIPPPDILVRFTNNQNPCSDSKCSSYLCMEQMSNEILSAGHASNSPDDVKFLTPAHWAAAAWNGVDTWDACVLPVADVISGIFPNVYTMRGLRELYYEVNPFADELHPTVIELDHWHIKVVNHYRRLLGFPEGANVAMNDADMYLRAQWSGERFYTTIWDQKYPVSIRNQFGPCLKPDPDPHCGNRFVPECVDQRPYFEVSRECMSTADLGSEGILPVQTHLPWSIKLSTALASVVMTEKLFLGGHIGPFHNGKKMGLHFSCQGNGLTYMRYKFYEQAGPFCPGDLS
jgi:hypothetical protein